MAIIAYPTLIAIPSFAPPHQSRFPCPCIVIVLIDTAIFPIVGGVHGFRIAWREHNDIGIGEGGKRGIGGKPIQNPFGSIAARFVRENRTEQVTLDIAPFPLGDGLLGIFGRSLLRRFNAAVVLENVGRQKSRFQRRIRRTKPNLTVFHVRLEENNPGLFRLTVASSAANAAVR